MRCRRRFLLRCSFLLLPAAVFSIVLTSSRPTFANQPECKDLSFIFARGSGQTLNAGEYTAWSKYVDKKLTPTDITYDSYELGNEPGESHQYPAVAVGIDHPLTSTAAALSDGQGFSYGQSVNKGVAELLQYIDTVAINCPTTQIVVGGYSQGAQIAGQTINALPTAISDHITFAALFGDPRLNLPEGKGLLPPACSGHNLSNWRRTVPSCRTSMGSLGPASYYKSDAVFSGHAGLWCASHDYICGSSVFVWDTSGHGAYKNPGGAIENAIDEAVGRAATKLPARLVSQLHSPGSHDIVINENVHCTANIDDQSYIDANSAVQAIQSYVSSTDGSDVIQAYTLYADPYSHITNDNFVTTLTSQGYRLRDNTPLVIYTFICNPPSDMQQMLMRRTLLYPRMALKQDNINTPTSVKFYTFTPASNSTSCVIANNSVCLGLEKNSFRLVTSNLFTSLAASFHSDTYTATLGQTIHFDVNPYYSPATATYTWDFDDDGIADATTDTAETDFAYAVPYEGRVSVTAHAANGAATAATSAVIVANENLAPPRPAAPKNLTITKISDSSIQLSWQPGDDHADRWLVIANDAPLGMVLGSQITSYVLTGVDFSQPLTIQLAAVTKDGKVSEYTLSSYTLRDGNTATNAYDNAQEWAAAQRRQLGDQQTNDSGAPISFGSSKQSSTQQSAASPDPSSKPFKNLPHSARIFIPAVIIGCGILLAFGAIIFHVLRRPHTK